MRFSSKHAGSYASSAHQADPPSTTNTTQYYNTQPSSNSQTTQNTNHDPHANQHHSITTTNISPLPQKRQPQTLKGQPHVSRQPPPQQVKSVTTLPSNTHILISDTPVVCLLSNSRQLTPHFQPLFRHRRTKRLTLTVSAVAVTRILTKPLNEGRRSLTQHCHTILAN